jgi:hypothetical protein
MSIPFIVLIIIAQIGVFQFGSPAFTRSVFALRLGIPPGPLADDVAAYFRKVTFARFTLGALLCLVALTALLGLPGDPGLRKLLLAIVSVTSSIAFAHAVRRDKQTLRTVSENLAKPSVRRASLEPRSIRRWYNPIWEVAPVAILAATMAFTVWIGYRLVDVPTQIWVYQVLQLVFVIGALIYTSRHGITVPNVSSRLAALRDQPELALRFGESLAAREMKYLMFAKIGVALLLGVDILNVGMRALDHGAASFVGNVSWAITGVLLLAFAGYVAQLVALTKRTMRQTEEPRHEG